MNRIVLDTNVLVSGMIHAHGPPGRIIDLIRESIVTIAVDDRILTEYHHVLTRPKFRHYFDEHSVRDILLFLNTNTEYCVPTRILTGLPDQDDVPFAEVALTLDIPIITGNKADFPLPQCLGIQILSPRDYMERHKSEDANP